MTRLRAATAVLAGLLLTGLWLRWAPAWVGTQVQGLAPATGEAVFTLSVFGPLLLLGLSGGMATGVAAFSPGRSSHRAVAMGGALGLGGLLLALALAAIAGALRISGGVVGAALLLGLATTILQVAAEEVLFRGWLQPLLARAIGAWAIPVVALAFAGLHLLAGGASGGWALVNLAGGGLLFGLLAQRHGGVAAPIAAHVAWNGGEQLLLGLDPNPGLGSFGALLDLDLVGAAHWGGSAEGLNASWAMTFALWALIVPLLLRWRSYS